MYIISVDIGSTNIKAIIMKINNDDIKLVGKVRKKSTDFAKLIDEIIDDYNIEEKNIEKVVVTGTGSTFINEKDNVFHFSIEKVDEFDAIGYGGLILAKKEEAIVASIGTGTAFVYSNLVENIHIGGTGLGGGAFVGLGRRFLANESLNDEKALNFNQLIELAKKGNKNNVDLLIGDINNGNIDNMTNDITAANFAAINKKATDADFVAGIINMILETICLMAKLYVKNLNNVDMPIIFVGTMVTDRVVQKWIEKIGNFTKNKYVFVDNADYAIAIGAYEYYLLRLRKNI